MKTTVLYHADADGFASAFAIWLKLGDTAIYIPVQYSQPVPEIPAGTDRLFIVDFSYKREICEELSKKYQLLILDHHKTAQKELEGLPYAHFDLSKSGCALTWEHFHEGRIMPTILAYVQDRDLWNFDLPDSEVINLYIATLSWDFTVWDFESSMLLNWLEHAKNSGKAVKAFQDNQIKSALKSVRMMQFTVGGDTWEVPVLNCSANVSEVGNRLCTEYPSAPFSVTYCDRADVRSWSLRSVGEFDVSRVARQLGGGGHKNAAGFSTEIGWPAYTSEEFISAFEEVAK